MDFKLKTDAKGKTTVAGGSESTCLNNIILSLQVPLGGYWLNPKFGSRLHLLTREKATPETAERVREAVISALKWLTDASLLSSVTVTTELASHRINYHVAVTQANGEPVEYTNYVEVV